MKILPVQMIRDADAYTIEHEPISDINLMERAANTCVDWLLDHFDQTGRFYIFCGMGNNGGDGWVIARQLKLSGYHVEVFSMGLPEKMSPSCRLNFERLKNEHPDVKITFPEESEQDFIDNLPFPEKSDVMIDAIFGSGLTRFPSGMIAKIIDRINQWDAAKISIDIPSGLFCDESVAGQKNPPIIQADFTLSFSPPKLAFFFPENERYVGEWIIHDIGIHPDFLASAVVKNYMTTEEVVAPLIRRRKKFAHKGNFGHLLLICGSKGKMGAAVLAAKAALRSGAGLVTVRVPADGVNIMQTAVPEAMISVDDHPDIISVLPDLSPYQTVGIGPGIGTSDETAKMVKLLIQEYRHPILFDADAINILAMNKTWLGFIPAGSVFTPHPKEFERLAGTSKDNFERNQLQRDFSVRYQCYIALKGAHTAITTPSGDCWFNTTGNPGMATGGSGDVLTGIIASLMAQGYQPSNAALTGVYLHGLAGDISLKTRGFESLIASDIIENIGSSFLQLYGKL